MALSITFSPFEELYAYLEENSYFSARLIGGYTTNKILVGASKNIKEWQSIITELAVSKGFNWTKNDVDTMLLRIHGEVSEASEAIRDDNFEGFAEEIADIFIRLVNLCEVCGIDLEKEVIDKHNKNMDRPNLHGRKKK